MADSQAYYYTTQVEIERLMSIRSVEDYSTDDSSFLAEDNAQIMLDIIAEATDTINLYCQKFYSEAVLSTSIMVRRWATWVACHLLTQRRGEPMRFEARYNDAVEKLTAISEGRLQLPRLPQRSEHAPAQSNYVIDDRYSKARSRVQRETSTGSGYANQPVDITISPYDPY